VLDVGNLQADLSVRGLVFDIDKFASHDGPGIRTVVFLKGCPLSCQWCHSPESQGAHPALLYQDERCTACWLCLDVCPEGALTKGRVERGEVAVLGRSRCTDCGKCVEVCYPGALKLAGAGATVGEVVEQVARDLPFFRSSGGGVTLSGGEPARQADFSYNILLACKQRGIHTALETTGYARWEVMSRLARVTDLFLYDLKFADSNAHRRCTGVPNRLILANLRKLAAERRNIQVRVPCIHGVNDGVEQIQATARLVKGYGVERIALLPYNTAAGAKYKWLDRPYPLEATQGQSDEYMARLAEICRDEGLAVQVGG
jgi:pyruvate formate lyase activating enzyme